MIPGIHVDWSPPYEMSMRGASVAMNFGEAISGSFRCVNDVETGRRRATSRVRSRNEYFEDELFSLGYVFGRVGPGGVADDCGMRDGSQYGGDDGPNRGKWWIGRR